MDVILINVRSDYDLIPGKESYGKFLPEQVGHFRGYLPDLKRLDDMIRLDAVFLAVMLLGSKHLSCGFPWIAVERGYQRFLVRLIAVFDVIHQLVQAHGLGEDLGYSHFSFQAFISARISRMVEATSFMSEYEMELFVFAFFAI